MSTENQLRLGSRGSRLALWQAEFVASQLAAAGYQCDIKIIKTQGDRIQHLGFDKLEGKGFFTKELEDALLSDEVDFAVHSMKDLSTTQPDGLILTAVSARANPVDVLLIHPSAYVKGNPLNLKKDAQVGTSSVRRKVQLNSLSDSLICKDIRGNVPTRIQKMENGEFDAIILAAAGIERLEIDVSAYHPFYFQPTEFVPAPAQGVLALQCRKEDLNTRRALQHIHVKDTLDTINTERKIMQLMDGGCQLPLGAYCSKDAKGYYHATAVYAKDLDSTLTKVSLSQNTNHMLAERVVEQLKKHAECT